MPWGTFWAHYCHFKQLFVQKNPVFSGVKLPKMNKWSQRTFLFYRHEYSEILWFFSILKILSIKTLEIWYNILKFTANLLTVTVSKMSYIGSVKKNFWTKTKNKFWTKKIEVGHSSIVAFPLFWWFTPWVIKNCICKL